MVDLWRRIPAWILRWDFALALALGALLRLLWLGDTSFLGDQAELLALGRSALAHESLVATGIRSSIGTLNPPAAIALLLPFAPLGNPIWATLATALTNVLAVALLYGLGNRYLGRHAAFAATLLYATASGPIAYSRFIWQQNLLAPIVILFFWTLCLGVIDHKRGWLGWNVLLWAVAIQLHTTALPLIALTLLGAWYVRAEVRLRDLAYAVGAMIILFAPTLAWEVASGGSDLVAVRAFATSRHGGTDDAAGLFLYELFTPTSALTPGSAALHTVTAPGVGALTVVVSLIYLAAQLWLPARVLSGVLPNWPRWLRWLGWAHTSAALTGPAPTGLATALDERGSVAAGSRGEAARLGNAKPHGMQAGAIRPVERRVARAALDEPQWRFLLLLGLWQGLPVVLMVRHSSAVHPHYLLVVLPATFLIVGVFLATLSRQFADWASQAWARLRPASEIVAPTLWARRAGYALALLVVLLAAAQSYGVLAQLNAIHSGAVNEATSSYGLTLTEQRQALQAAADAARQYDTQAMIATTTLLQEPLGYQAATNYAGVSAYIGANCLVTSATGAAPLVTLATPPVGAANLLGQLQGAQVLRTLSLPGAAPLPIYLLPATSHFIGETPIAASAASAAASGAYAVAYASLPTAQTARQLLIRWAGAPLANGAGLPTTGSRASAPYWFGEQAGATATAAAYYTFFAQPFDAAGQALAAPLHSTCGALAWGHGADVYSSIPLPTKLTHVES